MSEAIQILKKYWGYDSFRPQQEEIIQSVLDGKDTFALLPTGGGKSVCFQVPGLALEGVCLVVSPLIALMEDQVNQLTSRGIKAASIHSGLHKTEVERILENCTHGLYQFLYVSPERLKTEKFLARLERMPIQLVAIDEAHCISQWGHDFRPAYLEIANIREILTDVPFIALTATATEKVKADIVEFLGLKSPLIFTKSFARNNIRFIVRKVTNKNEKLLEICSKIEGSAIVYADTRKHTRDYAELLKQYGISADYYHAGLSAMQKTQRQSDWIKGKTRVICATNAFGMGIDKADVRLVIHPYIPSEPEGFYQEAGRAGRDGKTSLSVLLYNESDIENLHRFLDLKYPETATVKRIYSLLFQDQKIAYGSGQDFTTHFDLSAFTVKHGININTAHYSLKILEKAGLIALQNYGREQSRLMFRIDHTAVYKFQVANPNLDALLTIIIRSYGGTFEHMVAIDEMTIARRLNISVELVHKYLENLKQREVIFYEPKTNLPLLTFLKGRVQETYLTIPKDITEGRKKEDQHCIESMISYAHRMRCRMKMLLEYFGEKDAENCGKCDVCSSLNKMQLADKEFDQISTAIRIALKPKALNIHELKEKLNKFETEQVAEVLRWLLDNKEVKVNDREEYEL